MCVIILYYVFLLSYVMMGKGGVLCMFYCIRYKGEGIQEDDVLWIEIKLLVIFCFEYMLLLLCFEEGL